MSRIVAGGNSNFIIVLETEKFFSEGILEWKIYKLPSGFISIKKIKSLSDANWIAVLSEGQLMILQFDNLQLNIQVSFKLPCWSIIDFDVDHLINYALIVSSEGDVTIYDIEKAIQSEILITSS